MSYFTRNEIYKYLKDMAYNLDHPQEFWDITYAYMLAGYLWDYSDTQDAKDMLNFFAKACTREYDIEAIKKALSLPDDKPFYKKQEIMKVFPFAINNKPLMNDVGNMIDIVYHHWHHIENINDLLREYTDIEITDELWEQLIEFKKKNQLLFHTWYHKHESLEENHARFINLLENNHCSCKGFEDYCELVRRFDENKRVRKEDYYNYLIGEIGELITWERFSKMKNAEYISRDINDSFGYDIYFELNDIETLVEVKTTTDIFGNDRIRVSHHEFNTCMQAQKNNAKYIIARIYISPFDPYTFFYSLLQYDKEHDMWYDSLRDMEYLRVPNTRRHIYYNPKKEYLKRIKGFTTNTM